jgi:hypothetical protein
VLAKKRPFSLLQPKFNMTTTRPHGFYSARISPQAWHLQLLLTVPGAYCLSTGPRFADKVINVGSEDLTPVIMNSRAFWDITPCSPLKINLSKFRRNKSFPYSRWNKQSKKLARSRQHTSWFLVWLILISWWWRRRVPPKRRLTFNGLHGVISHNTRLFEVSGVHV